MIRYCLAAFVLLGVFDRSGAQDPDRAAIRKKMEEVMGPLPGKDKLVPADAKISDESKLEGYTRRKVTIAVEKGDRLPMWLLLPTGFRGKRPAVLCLHQTVAIGKDEPIGLGKRESLQYALHLVKRGYVCFVPDYPSFGEYPFDFKKSDFQSGSMKAIWNNMRAVDYLVTLPEVDGERLGVIGHSLGGHHSMFTAAFDERLKVIVSCCGFCTFEKYYKGNLKGWSSDRYMPRINSVYNNDPKKMPFDFTDVVASFAPRAFMAVSPLHDDNFEVDGVRDVQKYAEPIYAKMKAKDKLVFHYPDAKHDFPEESRKLAYEFMDKWLKP